MWPSSKWTVASLRLSAVEKAEAVHGDLHVPVSAVRSIEVIDDAHGMTSIRSGFKVGMRVPGRATVAVVRRAGPKLFVAVHHDTPRGVRVQLAVTPTTSGSSVPPTLHR